MKRHTYKVDHLKLSKADRCGQDRPRPSKNVHFEMASPESSSSDWPGIDSQDVMTPYQVEQVLLCCSGELGQSNLRTHVERALGRATVQTVVDNYMTSLRHKLDGTLTNRLLDFIRQQFSPVSQTSGFLNLPPEVIVVILRDNNLHVNSELDVYVAALHWLDYNKQERLTHAAEVMKCVRFSFISPSDIVRYVEPNKVLFDGEGKDILLSVYRTHMLILSGMQGALHEAPRNYKNPPDFLGEKYVYFPPDNHLESEVKYLHESFNNTSTEHGFHNNPSQHGASTLQSINNTSTNHRDTQVVDSNDNWNRYRFNSRRGRLSYKPLVDYTKRDIATTSSSDIHHGVSETGSTVRQNRKSQTSVFTNYDDVNTINSLATISRLPLSQSVKDITLNLLPSESSSDGYPQKSYDQTRPVGLTGKIPIRPNSSGQVIQSTPNGQALRSIPNGRVFQAIPGGQILQASPNSQVLPAVPTVQIPPLMATDQIPLRQLIQQSWLPSKEPESLDSKLIDRVRNSSHNAKTREDLSACSEKPRSKGKISKSNKQSNQLEKIERHQSPEKPNKEALALHKRLIREARRKKTNQASSLAIINSMNESLDKLISNVKNISIDKQRQRLLKQLPGT